MLQDLTPANNQISDNIVATPDSIKSPYTIMFDELISIPEDSSEANNQISDNIVATPDSIKSSYTMMFDEFIFIPEDSSEAKTNIEPTGSAQCVSSGSGTRVNLTRTILDALYNLLQDLRGTFYSIPSYSHSYDPEFYDVTDYTLSQLGIDFNDSADIRIRFPGLLDVLRSLGVTLGHSPGEVKYTEVMNEIENLKHRL